MDNQNMSVQKFKINGDDTIYVIDKIEDNITILKKEENVTGGNIYSGEDDITTLNSVFNNKEIQKQEGGGDIVTLNSLFNQFAVNAKQGGGNIFSSTSNMFNGFQNGGIFENSSTSASELDFSIFSQLNSKNKMGGNNSLSTLQSVFDM